MSKIEKFETSTKKYSYVGLEMCITKLETYYPKGGTFEEKFHIEYTPSQLIYMQDLKDCNDFVADYAFKHTFRDTLKETIDYIEDILTKSYNANVRIDIIFDRKTVAHLSKEQWYESDSRIICNGSCVNYNRPLNEWDRSEIYKNVRSHLYAYLIKKEKDNEQ